ncbi:MAG: hypothetical protein WC788_08150 [Candidatus Paceibacterota bacterium]|jgi:hypothetical protein
MEENKPSNADVRASGADAGAGSKDVQALELLNQTTGRNFTSMDEFRNHYDNLKNFVGENPNELKQKAKELDEFQTKYGMTPSELADRLANSQNQDEEAKKIASEAREKAKEREIEDTRRMSMDTATELQEIKLLRKYPEAEEVLDEVKALAKAQGKSLSDAYASSKLKSYAESKLAEKKAKEDNNNAMLKGNSRVGGGKREDLERVVNEANKGNMDGLIDHKLGHLKDHFTFKSSQ